MGIILALTLFSVGAVGLQAQAGYEASLMGKDFLFDEPQVLLFPYSAYYLNNRVSGKLGVEFANGWEARVRGGFAQTLIPDGYSPISVNGWYDCYQYTKWRSIELSASAELGRSLRLRAGKGDIFLGAEALWGHYECEVLLYAFDDTAEYYDTVLASANGFGIQGFAGLNYPLIRFSHHLTLNLTGMLTCGEVGLSPDKLPPWAEWGSYSYPGEDVSLPRWGIGAGLTLIFDSREEVNTEALLDARMKPVPMRAGCLFGGVDTVRSCIGGCCMTGVSSPFGQATTAFLLGPGIGIPVGLLGAAMMYDNDASSEIVPLALGCYLWSPVGSVIGTMAGGRLFNPGGSWAYTLAGAFLGQIANLFLAETYRIAVGANPWRGLPGLSAYFRDAKKGTYIVIPIASILPTVGALAGYNLSLRHAAESPTDTLGFRPSWSELAKENFRGIWNSRNRPSLELDLVRVTF